MWVLYCQISDDVTDGIANVATKMGNVGATAQFMMYKIQAIFQKLLALYVTLLYFAWSMMKGLESMIRDPVLVETQGVLDKAVKIVDDPGAFVNDVGKALNKSIDNTSSRAKKNVDNTNSRAQKNVDNTNSRAQKNFQNTSSRLKEKYQETEKKV